MSKLEIQANEKLIESTKKEHQFLFTSIRHCQKKLELFIAQLRAISVEVVEQIVKWQADLKAHRSEYDVNFASTRGRIQKGALQAPFFWRDPKTLQDENYLLKMKGDCAFIHSDSIVREWIGFNCNTFYTLFG